MISLRQAIAGTLLFATPTLLAEAPGKLTPQMRSNKLAPPEHLRDYVKDGQLSLSLRDAIILTLENNSAIRVDRTAVDSSIFPVLSAYSPFDPLIQASLNINRYSYPGDSELQGIGQATDAAQNNLSQTGQISYTQTFKTGTNVVASISSNRTSTNNSFFFFNPYFSSSFNFTFTQSLLRNFGVATNTALITIAQRTLKQSRVNFQAQVNDAILETVTEYWAVVQARGNLVVEQKSLDLAEASYNRDKRALELGALSPLDIYRSQSEQASRHLSVIQGQYALKRTEDQLRLTIGADQDPSIAPLPLDLTEKPEPEGSLDTPEMQEVMTRALASRPEIEASTYSLANDETSIRVAHNQLKPDLSLNGFYESSGLGGNQYNLTTGALISHGGFDSSFTQLGNFGYPGYGGTLSLNLPIHNSAARANLGTALVSRRHDLYSARQTREEITRQVTDAVHQLEEAKLTLTAGKASFELAQKSLTAEQRKYELGTETNFFVLDAQSKLAQADLDLLETQVNYQVARASVDHAMGTLLDPYQIQIKDLSK